MGKKLVLIFAVIAVIAAFYNHYRDGKQSSIPLQQNYNGQNVNGQIYGGQNQLPVAPVVPALPGNAGTNAGSRQSTQRICSACHGSGSCPICHGTGYYSNYGFRSPCNACDDYQDRVDSDGQRPGNGVCSACHGTGLVQ